MATLLENPQTQPNKLFLHGITWNQLQNLESSFNDIAGVRLIYLDRILEIMIYSLKNNQYFKVNKSKLLPELNLETLTKYINYHDQYDAVTEFINELK